MKNKLFLMLVAVIFIATTFAKNVNNSNNGPVSIQVGNDDPISVRVQNPSIDQSREEIDLFVEDFEDGAPDWTVGSGWQSVDGEYGASPTKSMHSPNDDSTLNGTWDLLSPTVTLPSLGEGETMNFSFWLKGDTPDTDGDGDNYLEDY